MTWPKLSFTIMAHKKRANWVPDLQSALQDCSVTWDKVNDRHETGLRAILAYDADADWHVVVQDDALLCQDFMQTSINALRQVPRDSPACFYMGRVPQNNKEMFEIYQRAKKMRASFIAYKGPWWGVAIAFPTSSIKDLAQFYKSVDVPNYDRRASRFYEARGNLCYYTNPSIVNHRVNGNPSLVADRQNQGRFAWNYLTSKSGLAIDWTGPVLKPSTTIYF